MAESLWTGFVRVCGGTVECRLDPRIDGSGSSCLVCRTVSLWTGFAGYAVECSLVLEVDGPGSSRLVCWTVEGGEGLFPTGGLFGVVIPAGGAVDGLQAGIWSLASGVAMMAHLLRLMIPWGVLIMNDRGCQTLRWFHHVVSCLESTRNLRFLVVTEFLQHVFDCSFHTVLLS